MSEYHDPSYQTDFSQGYEAPGSEPSYGDDGAGYETAYAEEQAYGDEGAYQDVAYGDQGAYQEDVAYGDQGAYQEDVAYGDQGAYQEDVAYGDEGAYQQGYEGYAQDGYDYAEGGQEPYAEEEPADEPPAKPGPDRKKLLILSAVGLALIGAMGAGGYFLLMAPAQEGAGGGFDLGAVMRMIPFLGPKDSDESLAANQANVLAIKKAVDMFAAKEGRLPASAEEVEAQLKATGWELTNPYDVESPIAIEYGEVPTQPGAIAFAPAGEGYAIRVGNAQGAPMSLDGQEYVVSGKPPAQAASRPMAVPQGKKPVKPPAAKPSAQPAQVAAQPSAEEPDDEPTPAPTPRPTPTPAQLTPAQRRERNQEFDRWRNRGIALVYEQRTAEAVVAFKKALAIRPGDSTVTRWLQTIQGVIDEHTATEKAKYKEQALQVKPQPNSMPVLPPDPAREAEQDTHKLLEELKRRELEKRGQAPTLAAPKLE